MAKLVDSANLTVTGIAIMSLSHFGMLAVLTAWLAVGATSTLGAEPAGERMSNRPTRVVFATEATPEIVDAPSRQKSDNSSSVVDADASPSVDDASTKTKATRKSRASNRSTTAKHPNRRTKPSTHPIRRISASDEDVQLAPVIDNMAPPLVLELNTPEDSVTSADTAALPDPIQARREVDQLPAELMATLADPPVALAQAQPGSNYLQTPDLDDLFSSPPAASGPASTPPAPTTPRSPGPTGPVPGNRENTVTPRPSQPLPNSNNLQPPVTAPTTPPGPSGPNGNRPSGTGNDALFDDINPFRDDDAPTEAPRSQPESNSLFDAPFGNPLTGQVSAEPSSSRGSESFDLGQLASNNQAVASDTPLASIPHVMGDFFDGGTRTVTYRDAIASSFHTTGQLLSASPVSFAFERDGVGFPDDFFTVGQGLDTNDDGIIDTYSISEPIAPNDVPTSPGAQYTFDGGTAVFTNNTSSTTPPANVPIPVSGDSTWFASYSFSQQITAVVPAAGGGVAVRRFKIAENNSPLPQDRFFFNYSFFNDVATNLGDVSRYTVGFEKTHWDGLGSWELRLPFAATVDHEQTIDTPVVRNFEFGNLMFTWKGLFYFDENYSVAAGMGVTVPTANDTGLSFVNGQRIMTVRNDAMHFLPYLAGSRTIGDRGFIESFLQFDFDANGNKVYANTPSSGVTGLPRIGRLNDSSFLFVDTAFGYWIYQNDAASLVNGIAPIAEFHYSSTITDADVVSGNGVVVTDNSQRSDILNLTVGTHFKLRSKGRVAIGGTIPLRDGDDDPFDYEILVQANRLF